MGRRRFSIEFKNEAVQLMILDGLSATEVSTKLGVNTNQLYRWKRLYLDDQQGEAISRAKPPQSDRAVRRRWRPR